MRLKGIVVGLVLLLGVAAVAYFTQDHWRPLLTAEKTPEHEEESPPVEEPKVLKLTPQARKNLRLTSKPVAVETYWRTVQIPGVVIDRPGRSDRGITAPAVGVVSQVHAFSGETVRPGDLLFTLQLLSEYLQKTQSDLFKATRETELIKENRARLEGLATQGTIAGSRIIELDQQIRRQEGLIQAYRQDLLTRGITPAQLDQIASGNFVSTMQVVAPPLADDENEWPTQQVALVDDPDGQSVIYEVEDLMVDLGQQVQAGQLLCVLSNHRSLFIEGHAFKHDAPMLEHAARNGWPVEVEFAEDDSRHWPPFDQTFEIHHLSNRIDPSSRTFDFFIPLTNQARGYEKDGKTFVVWRLRPGQRVRIHVPVEKLENVIVMPAGAVVREGPEAYVFRQNGDLFNRLPIHVLHEDRLNVVLANDGSILPGSYLAQGSAASLNRVLKAQAASGMRADVHVHADGTVHESH